MAGAGAPPDLTAIPTNAILLRRVHPSFIKAEASGETRLSSGAFQELEMAGVVAMSVLVEDLLNESGFTFEDVVLSGPDWGLVAFPVSLAFECGLTIELAPEPREGELGFAHAHVFGIRRRHGIQKQLASGSVRRVWPHVPTSPA